MAMMYCVLTPLNRTSTTPRAQDVVVPADDDGWVRCGELLGRTPHCDDTGVTLRARLRNDDR
jgi:hypothetical protein